MKFSIITKAAAQPLRAITSVINPSGISKMNDNICCCCFHHEACWFVPMTTTTTTMTDTFISFPRFLRYQDWSTNPSFIKSTISVTRLGKILPLCRNFKSLKQIYQDSFSIWQNFEHTWAILLCYWAKFHCCKWPNIEKNLSIWSHCQQSETTRQQ